jgi:hypothetical protein
MIKIAQNKKNIFWNKYGFYTQFNGHLLIFLRNNPFSIERLEKNKTYTFYPLLVGLV